MKVIQNTKCKESFWPLHCCGEEAGAHQLNKHGTSICTMTKLDLVIVDSISVNDSNVTWFGA